MTEESEVKPSWSCPVECPFQTDDSPITRYKSWAKRYWVFLAILGYVIALTYNVVAIERRIPSKEEFGLALAVLVIALEKPALITEIISKKLGI